MLARLISEEWSTTETTAENPCIVDANPDRFQYILDFYRLGKISIPWDVSVEAMKSDADYFGLVKVNISRDEQTIGSLLPLLRSSVSAIQSRVKLAQEQFTTCNHWELAFDLIFWKFVVPFFINFGIPHGSTISIKQSEIDKWAVCLIGSCKDPYGELLIAINKRCEVQNLPLFISATNGKRAKCGDGSYHSCRGCITFNCARSCDATICLCL